MKKIISLLLISFTISITSINTTSCFLFGNKNKGDTTVDLDDVKDKIENAKNIILRGVNIPADSSKEQTSNLILNNIGLTSDEKKSVSSLSGTLLENSIANITFNLKDSNTNTTETVDQNVTWWKESQDPNISSKELYDSILLDNNHILVSGEEGLYESDDNGDNFVLLDNGIPTNYDTTKILQTSDGYIYVGTNNAGLFRSTDNGKNFKIVRNFISTNIDIFALLETDNGDIYCGGSNNILYKSNDEGALFGSVETFSGEIYSLLQDSNGDIYVGTNHGLYKSVDNGGNFSKIGDLSLCIALLQASNNDIYVVANNLLYKNTDNGENFSQVDSFTTSDYIYSLFQASNGDIYVGTAADGLYVSNDNGESFTNLDEVTFNKIGSINEINNVIYITSKINWSGIGNKGVMYLAV